MAELKTVARPHNMAGSFNCALCGDYHQQRHADVALVEANGEEYKVVRGDICPACVEAGPAGAADRTRRRASLLQKRVEELFSLASMIEGVSDWATLEELHQAEIEAHRHFLEDELECGVGNVGTPF